MEENAVGQLFLPSLSRPAGQGMLLFQIVRSDLEKTKKTLTS